MSIFPAYYVHTIFILSQFKLIRMNEETVQQGMDYLSLDDWTTELNTQLNKSGVLMDTDDNSVDSVRKRKVRKSITLNLEIQPSVSISNFLKPSATLKGILKKTDNNVVRETGRDYYQKIQKKGSIETEPRPHNVSILIYVFV